ncbi:MAG: hypothetical protein K0R19_1064 [Bacillota bacterium]|jgi:hypothetical protein|nr:hypothetical protein [Bacillota bacterium]
MKKFLFFILLAVTLLPLSAVQSFAAERTVSVSLPAFTVQINGTVINSKTTKYPLLVYKNITYLPMTYDYCNLLGLESSWTQEKGFTVSLRKGTEIPTVTEYISKSSNPARLTATVVSTPVTVNGKRIDNTKEPYPFLRYQDVTYFPLTYQFTNQEFNIYSNFSPEYGLGVYSENKFYYQYYPEGSNLLHTDLRLSTILYSMTAINISDGTGKYPSNNVKQYRYPAEEVLMPNYKDTRYYGYLPDGSGGLKVNTDSKLFIGRLITTVISDLANPLPVTEQLEIHANYAE